MHIMQCVRGIPAFGRMLCPNVQCPLRVWNDDVGRGGELGPVWGMPDPIAV